VALVAVQSRGGRLLILSYVGMLGLYVGWYSEFYRRPENFAVTLFFATMFFAIFCRRSAGVGGSGREFAAAFFPAALTLINTGVLFSASVRDGPTRSTNWLWLWFALALAAVHIGLSRIVRRQEPADAEMLRLLHLALAVSLITIAIPIRLDGHWITVAGWWKRECCCGGGTGLAHAFLHYLAVVALGLAVVRLLLVDNFRVDTLLLNSRMATYILAMAVLGLLAWFSLRRAGDFDRQLAALAVLAVSALALVWIKP